MIAGLFFFLVLAVIIDLRAYRIPNALTMAGMAAGVIYQLCRAGPSGMFIAVKDLICSILILFPLYMIRCLGAGDIKLLSVITVFLGWKQGMIISIYSLFAGAAMGIIKGSILFALRRRKSADQQTFMKTGEEVTSKEPADDLPAGLPDKHITRQIVMKNPGKGVYFYSAGKAVKMTNLTDKRLKKVKKEVAEYLRKNNIRFLRITKADKNRQKERDHIEQIRTAKQLKQSNNKDRIGETSQIYYCLSQINKANQLNINQNNQFRNTILFKYLNHIDRTNQLQHKKGIEDQGCVIHYSIAILIAFLIIRLR